MAELPAVNGQVVGSSPTSGAYEKEPFQPILWILVKPILKKHTYD